MKLYVYEVNLRKIIWCISSNEPSLWWFERVGEWVRLAKWLVRLSRRLRVGPHVTYMTSRLYAIIIYQSIIFYILQLSYA